MGIPKIKNATRLRQTLYDTLDEVAEGKPHLIIRKDNEAVMLISQKDFDRLTEERDTLRAISLGVAELEAGKTVSHRQALKRLHVLKSRWK